MDIYPSLLVSMRVPYSKNPLINAGCVLLAPLLKGLGIDVAEEEIGQVVEALVLIVTTAYGAYGFYKTKPNHTDEK